MSTTAASAIDIYFEKQFSFVPDETWTLPSPHVTFKDDLWIIEKQYEIKSMLNLRKSELNNKGEDWQKHTAQVNLASLVSKNITECVKTDIMTGAWCKFYEILHTYSLINCELQELKSLHLCEVPGAFISALNCYLSINYPDLSWDWCANSLNPYYEGHDIRDVIVDDRLLFPTLKNWHFGADDTGDITLDSYWEDLNTAVSGTLFNLITADGSINCMRNPAEQELNVANIQFAEMMVMLRNLAPGGSFVLKKFTFFESISICQMYFLNCVFKNVHVFKPFTSKFGNSEVYIICLQYKGVEYVETHVIELTKHFSLIEQKAMFPLSSIPSNFLDQITQCSDYFASLQMQSIKENLDMFTNPSAFCKEERLLLQEACAKRYLEKCNIVQKRKPFYSVLFNKKKKIKTSFYTEKGLSCKFLTFRVLGETFENLMKSEFMTFEENILDVEKKLNDCFTKNFKRSLTQISWVYTWKEVKFFMKSRNYRYWIKTGKKFAKIANTKFCNPLLLHLWNRITLQTEVKDECHSVKSSSSWDLNSLLDLLKRNDTIQLHFVPISMDKDALTKSDPIISHLKDLCTDSLTFTLYADTIEIDQQLKNKILYINSTHWSPSLHHEMKIKTRLVEALIKAVKLLADGDCLIFCIQSLLTRYTVGIMFIIMSLFEKFTCLLPYKGSPAMCGQIWLLHNFENPQWTQRVLSHFESILLVDLTESEDILEVVPLQGVCSKLFYEFLLHNNNCHLLQRIQSLIGVEKFNFKKCNE